MTAQMTRLGVGEKIPTSLNLAPIEGFSFLWGDSITIFALFKNMMPLEAVAFRDGDLEFAIYEKESVLFFLCKAQTTGWNEMPFHLSLDLEHPPVEQILGPQERISAILVSAEPDNMIVKTIRFFSLSHEFTAKLLEIGRRQVKNPININQFLERVSKVQKSMEPDQMAKRAIVTCKAGD